MTPKRRKDAHIEATDITKRVEERSSFNARSIPETRLRQLETSLACATLWSLLFYVPLETWASLPYGLLNPFYLVDVIAMALLAVGAAHSLRARPRPAPGLLCAGIAWAAANGWRATFGRIVELRSGGSLDHGAAEMWAVSVATTLALACLGLALYLVARAERP
jgi:hypothetical protein